ncbi:MAG TPA: xanthine dehydrogenase family protein molybdopterin-binding subunit [Burkholderiales bacterium]|nr:xanthine dehydrogenase family protein molybdopterin-binding subunit [Burkholderiales bacterium]
MRREPEHGVVGRPHPRIEAPDKVTGRARYSADVRLPGQLQARILRSPHPHARVVGVDTGAAAALPGVRAVISSADAPAIRWYEKSLLFDTTLRFAGDEVAAVAAETEEIAEDALRLIRVEYQPLPFNVSLEDGARGEADVYRRGDAARGLREAEVVVEQVYTTQTALHNALEPHGCVAAWEGERLVLYESTQGVFSVRDGVAEALGLAKDAVRVVTPHMGGGFGAKQIAWKHSVIAALLARRAGRPVQILLERDAENLAAGNRNATRQRVRLGARRDGTLTAVEARILMQVGAYSAGGESSAVAGIYSTLYRCANVHTEQVQVFTNTGPAIAFRAPGYAEGAFGLESAMDELARALRMDPIELRLRNYAERHQEKDKPYTSPESLRRCYERVKEASAAFERQHRGKRRRGIGFAAGDWIAGSGSPPGYAWVRLEDEQHATVITGAQDIGTGTRTALCQVAADELGLPLENVSIQIGDSGAGPYGPTSHGSTTLATLGPAVRAAAEAARENRHGEGARGPNPQGKAVRTCGAQCAQVEVDLETGEITVLRLAAAHDCGLVVNPLLVDSQVLGAVTQGVGFALFEERRVDRASGLVLNANLEEYKVPTAADAPEVRNVTLSMPDLEANVLGSKGIGEPPIIPAAPAIANAVFDAVGVRIRDLPLLREKLLEALGR